ncbi:MAG: hypothetical protein DRP09_17200, partial [Candidatus Thorarchaeota archaeon]
MYALEGFSGKALNGATANPGDLIGKMREVTPIQLAIENDLATPEMFSGASYSVEEAGRINIYDINWDLVATIENTQVAPALYRQTISYDYRRPETNSAEFKIYNRVYSVTPVEIESEKGVEKVIVKGWQRDVKETWMRSESYDNEGRLVQFTERMINSNLTPDLNVERRWVGAYSSDGKLVKDRLTVHTWGEDTKHATVQKGKVIKIFGKNDTAWQQFFDNAVIPVVLEGEFKDKVEDILNRHNIDVNKFFVEHENGYLICRDNYKTLIQQSSLGMVEKSMILNMISRSNYMGRGNRFSEDPMNTTLVFKDNFKEILAAASIPQQQKVSLYNLWEDSICRIDKTVTVDGYMAKLSSRAQEVVGSSTRQNKNVKYNSFGDVVEAVKGGRTYHYLYDDLGRLSEIFYRPEKDSYVWIHNLTYNGLGLLAQRDINYFKEMHPKGYKYVRYYKNMRDYLKYDIKGNLKKTVNNDYTRREVLFEHLKKKKKKHGFFGSVFGGIIGAIALGALTWGIGSAISGALSSALGVAEGTLASAACTGLGMALSGTLVNGLYGLAMGYPPAEAFEKSGIGGIISGVSAGILNWLGTSTVGKSIQGAFRKVVDKVKQLPVINVLAKGYSKISNVLGGIFDNVGKRVGYTAKVTVKHSKNLFENLKSAFSFKNLWSKGINSGISALARYFADSLVGNEVASAALAGAFTGGILPYQTALERAASSAVAEFIRNGNPVFDIPANVSGSLIGNAFADDVYGAASTQGSNSNKYNCAVNALYGLARSEGKELTKDEIAEYLTLFQGVSPVSGTATSLAILKKTAEALGLNYTATRSSLEELARSGKPFIAHLNLASGEGHYVVVTKVEDNSVTYIDNGVKKVTSREEFEEMFSGYALVKSSANVFAGKESAEIANVYGAADTTKATAESNTDSVKLSEVTPAEGERYPLPNGTQDSQNYINIYYDAENDTTKFIKVVNGDVTENVLFAGKVNYEEAKNFDISAPSYSEKLNPIYVFDARKEFGINNGTGLDTHITPDVRDPIYTYEFVLIPHWNWNDGKTHIIFCASRGNKYYVFKKLPDNRLAFGMEDDDDDDLKWVWNASFFRKGQAVHLVLAHNDTGGAWLYVNGNQVSGRRVERKGHHYDGVVFNPIRIGDDSVSTYQNNNRDFDGFTPQQSGHNGGDFTLLAARIYKGVLSAGKVSNLFKDTTLRMKVIEADKIVKGDKEVHHYAPGVTLEANYILSCQYNNPESSAYGAINNVKGEPTWVVPGENAMAILGLLEA